MDLSPFPAIIGSLYVKFMIVLAALAVYALVLAVIFLGLRIAELKRGELTGAS